jgi:chromosome segregation ATPase
MFATSTGQRPPRTDEIGLEEKDNTMENTNTNTDTNTNADGVLAVTLMRMGNAEKRASVAELKVEELQDAIREFAKKYADNASAIEIDEIREALEGAKESAEYAESEADNAIDQAESARDYAEQAIDNATASKEYARESVREIQRALDILATLG